MKEWVKSIAVKTSVFFTIVMLMFCVAELIFAGPQYAIIIALSLFLACILMTVLRWLWFTDAVIKKLSFGARIFGFGACAFVLLAACAWAFKWFPVSNPGAWVLFIVIFFATLAIFSIGYQIHYKHTAGSFDAALQAYHEKMDQE